MHQATNAIATTMSVMVEGTYEGLSSTSNAKEDNVPAAPTVNLRQKRIYTFDEMFQLLIQHGKITVVKGCVEEIKCYCLIVLL